MAAGRSVAVEPARWQELFDEVMGRVAGRFARVELRRRARAFVGKGPPNSGKSLTLKEAQELSAQGLGWGGVAVPGRTGRLPS